MICGQKLLVKLLGLAWLWHVWSLPAVSQGIVINEVMPLDTSLLADEDGDYSGWVEVWNRGGTAINLNGYGLSDEPERPFKWTFPPINLPSQANLIVFLSGKNRRDLPGLGGQATNTLSAELARTASGLSFWLDAADTNSLLVVDGQVACWRDKSGRRPPSTDPDPVAPDAVPGLRLWLDGSATNTVRVDRGGVVVWLDRSGNTNHAWQADGGARPLSSLGGPGGLRVLRFDGQNDFMNIPRLNKIRTVFWVAREDPMASDSLRPVLGDTDSYDFHRGFRGSVFHDAFDVRVFKALARAWLNAREINAFTTPLPEEWCLVVAALNQPLEANTIGTDRRLPSRFWQGDIGELLIYEEPLTDEARAGVQQYLILKWDLPRPVLPTSYDAVQERASKRPAVALDRLDDRPVVRFDGVDDYLTFPRMEQVRTVFWVGREDLEASDAHRPLLGDTAFHDFHRGDDRIIYSDKDAAPGVAQSGTWLDGTVINPVTTRLPRCRTMVVTSTLTNCSANALGTDRLQASAFWQGDICELLLYARPLTAEEHQTVTLYLMQKWRLPTHYLHTSFLLGPATQWLLLTAPNGTLASRVSPAVPRSDLSLGLTPSGTNDWLFCPAPTPGRPNSSSGYKSITPEPIIRPSGGFFAGPVTVLIETNEWTGSVYYTLNGSEPVGPFAEMVDVVWLEDSLPPGALMGTQGNDRWDWVGSSPSPYSGALAHQSGLDSGLHQHFFMFAMENLPILEGDTLIAYVYVDPLFTPVQIMVQWQTPDLSWEHRAYWGADRIQVGVPGTPSCVFMGPLPPPAKWVRLEVPASSLGLEGAIVTGMAFTLFDGRVTWDYVGKATRKTRASQVYREPLVLSSNAVLRAKAFGPEAAPSRVVTDSYFVGAQSSVPVVSLVTDPDNFFSEETGIYATGPRASVSLPFYGANFWENWERPVHVEFFEPDGRRGFSLEAGVKIHGGWTRCAPQKALCIYARRKYGPGEIRYPVFPGLPVDRFESLVLRNSGNDWASTLMRDTLVQSLAEDLDVDLEAGRQARLYINGRFWGVYQIRERHDEHYLAAHYQVALDGVDIIETENQIVAGDMENYGRLLGLAAGTDLAKATNFARVAQEINLANFIDYQSTEIYADNTDWPGRNVQCWRPRVAGGRWRWLLHDLDHAFDLMGDGPGRNTFEAATIPNEDDPTSAHATTLLRNLLKNSQFREQFLGRFADLLNTAFAPKRVLRRIGEMRAELAPEMPLHIARWRGEAARWKVMSDTNDWELNVGVLREFAWQRPGLIRQHLVNSLNLGGTAGVTLAASNAVGGELRLNTLTLEAANLPWTGTYFQNVPLTVTAVPKAEYRFLGWAGVDSTNASLRLTLTNDLSLTAVFISEADYNYANLRPKPFDLWAKPYACDNWAGAAPAQTYPPSMIFCQTASRDPTLTTETDSEWTLPYNLDSKSRIRGLGERGFSFLNTGEAQDSGGGYLGAALLALRTTDLREIQVTWTGGTVSPNSRLYAIRLQYRVGAQGPFIDVTDATGNPVEYVRSPVVGDSRVFGPVLLPVAVNNQPVIQLRWKYYFIPTGASGARAELRVDDIRVTGTPQSLPTLTALRRTANTGLQAEFAHRPGRYFMVWASSNLVNWWPVQTLPFDSEGKAKLEQPIKLDYPACFYRLQYP